MPQEGSRFPCGSSVLGDRFVLLHLLGKGGFSEVFKVRVCFKGVFSFSLGLFP